MSPQIAGETTMELFNFMKQYLNRPIDVFETMQRVTVEVLGKLAFGHKFGVSNGNLSCIVLFIYLFIYFYFFIDLSK